MNKSSLLMACYGEHNKSLIGDHLDQHLIEVNRIFFYFIRECVEYAKNKKH